MPQYLLTESEYIELQSMRSAEHENYQEVIQGLCTQIAEHQPVAWMPGRAPEPWGCIIVDTKQPYCDECPAKKYCPYPNKQWSK